MADKWHGGKGDKPRKTSNSKKFSDGWDRIFGNKNSGDEKYSDGKGLDKPSK